MNEPRDLKSVKAFLLRHGHTKEEIERLDKESVINLYEKDTRKNTLNFLHYMNEDTFSVISTLDEADIGEFKLKVQENLDNMAILVDIIRDGFNDFSYADIADTLTLNIKNISIHKLQRILRIAYREFQEILLDKIATQLKELPIEEYKTIMNHYESIRGDTARLRSTIQELSDEKKRQQILDMARFKLLIVKDFMSKNTFNDVYKEYLNNTPEKLKLVEDILILTGMYSKNYLKNVPMEELEDMKAKLLEHKRQDERDHKIFTQYTQMLDESMYGSNEQEFSDVCVKIITGLNQKQILMISDYLSAKNPVFVNRFNTLLRDFKNSLKN
ncbi:hypothetical protein LS66_003845 [Helicobacter sp. MIT 03-1614]|jgi:hypothetical protein|uniref:Uncharacterized protein n=1 Tax=Helicobacter hepaticus (strain ATCC 51449 / 3B1) TaxID=235279 RepID=Q7VII3_HELHP|nr:MULTISPECIES: hypothetical protein [Helicobacter]AAP77219.1 hypothetical protein HH_0622 [Helicobacter hepaticus ATCC 51449]TLD90006.1 hypothetical protein LS66_003845 [Helicobacter sp. MIT 03-1614]